MLRIKDDEKILDDEFLINKNMIKAAVIGDPISHSLSPKIHGFFLKKYQIQGSYEAIKVSKEELEKSVQKLVDEGFAGFNVTIPHKEAIYNLCHYKSKTAQLTGAVNTVIVTTDKKLFGHNSDAEGFLNNLKNSQIKNSRTKNSQADFDLKNKAAFVIGAGGAARAIVYGLIKSGVKKIIITNRSEDRALKLIEDFKKFSSQKKCELKFFDAQDFTKNLFDCDLLINSTSLGMVGQERLDLNLANLKKSAIVCDIVYKPLITELLISAQKQGNEIVTGIGMLIQQALIGFEAWFGKKPEVDEELEKKLIESS